MSAKENLPFITKSQQNALALHFLSLNVTCEEQTNIHSLCGLPIKGSSNNSYRFTNPNNVRIWVGGWFHGNGLLGFPVKKKIRAPRNAMNIRIKGWEGGSA